MKYAIALLPVLILAGCEDPAPRFAPHCEPNTPGRADWILKCAEAANPMSDEEGEDLVSQCERTSNALFCPEVLYRWNGARWEPIPGAEK